MSCPPEATYLLYADGELAGDALREAETHLMTCRDCRALVVELRNESELLYEVLAERATSPVRDLDEIPEPSVAFGVPLAVAATTAAIAALGFLSDSRLPGALDLIHPRRLKGAAEMGFDVVFLMRENAPGFVELAISVGVVAAFSALGSFAVSVASRRLFGGTALLGLALLALPEPVSAVLVSRDQDLRIGSGERIEETVVATGDRVDVDGTIDGDLLTFAERVTVRGTVTGSLYVFCRDLDVTGEVKGALHGVTETTRIEGKIGGRIYMVGEDFTLTSTGRTATDIGLMMEDTVIEGEVGRDAYVNGERLDIRGRIGRNVTSHFNEEVNLRDGAHVGGDVRVRIAEGRDVDRAPGARVEGEVSAEMIPSPREHYLDTYRKGTFYVWHLMLFAGAFVFGLLIHLIEPDFFRGGVVTGGDFFRTLGLGFVVLVVFPVAMLVTALTVVGIPVAVVALFAYIVALYTAELVVGAWVGRLVWAPSDDSTLAFGRSFAVGFAIVTVVSHVPFIGPPVGVVALLLGLGMLTLNARELWNS